MAPMGEVVRSWAASGSFSSEVVIFSLLFLLLSILLLTLCTYCERRSFELQQPVVERTPSMLIKVIKLEDALAARENPMIDEIRKDEKEFSPIPEDRVPEVSIISPAQESSLHQPWRSHLGAPDQQGNSVGVSRIVNGTPGAMTMRSLSGDVSDSLTQELHSAPAPISTMEIVSNLQSPALQDTPIMNSLDSVIPAAVVSSVPLPVEVFQGAEEAQDRLHLYETIGARQLVPEVSILENPLTELGLDLNSTSLLDRGTTAATQCEDSLSLGASDMGWNPMYARVSRKSVKCPTPPPVPPPEDEDEEESSPPLPDRSGEGEGPLT